MSELLSKTVYVPNQPPVVSHDYQPSQLDYELMTEAIQLGGVACAVGTTPIGTVLRHTPTGQKWSAANTEFFDDDLLGHPELSVYREAQPTVGRDLSDCVMYTGAEPCLGCSYWLDKGRLGTLFIAARRSDVDFFRDRHGMDMDNLFRISRRPLTVISGLMIAEAQELLRPVNNVHSKV